MIAIVDTGLSNVSSVANMLRRIGERPKVTDAPEEIAAADRVILPGVGAFDSGVAALQRNGLAAALDEARTKGSTILGICLGMQLMAQGSDEGELPGLGWFAGRARKLQAAPRLGLRVPHMGWCIPSPVEHSRLLGNLHPAARYYFVHSYHVAVDEPAEVAATFEFDGDRVAAVERDNLFGVQFHPEKSHKFGKALLERFLTL